jgi:predicted aspartyl protease
MIRVAVLVVAALLVGRPAPADAQIYRWVDERGVTHFVQGIDSVPQKYRSAAVPFDLSKAPGSSRTPAVTGASMDSGAGSTAIKFMKGEAIIVDATINGKTSVKLILDTGADRTVITPGALSEAGVSLTEGPTGQIRGATGTASVQTAALDSLEIGDAKVRELLVIAHDIEQGGVDGLLGRDFLDQFKLSIDSENGVATLAPKSK